MNKAIQTLGSLKLTVALVLLIAVVLSAGTILESLRGAEQARVVYYAPWFFALQGLFALNLIAALIDRWPRNRYRIGFAVTHLSMLIILGGALVTELFKVDGSLPIWEGDASSHVFLRDLVGGQRQSFDLPFSVRVDSFEIDRYQGTMMPSMFRSRVTVLDPAGGQLPAVIEMNKPLSYGGYQFFQSSYQIENGREATILSVSRDPGQPIVFLGYVLLVAGMIVVFVTRLQQHAEAARQPARPTSIGLSARAGLVALALLGLPLAAPAGAAQVPDAATAARVRTLPVQHDGRTMPFDTQARESVRKVTGKRAWPGIDPVAMTLGWATDPQGWSEQPIVKVPAAVAEVAGLPAGTRYTSFRALVDSQSLRDASRATHARLEGDETKPTAEEKDLLAVEERLTTLDGYFRGQAIRAIPVADPNGTWQVLPGAPNAAALAGLEAQVRANAPAHYPTGDAIDRELSYNARRPTRLGWLLLLPAAIAAALTLERDRWRLEWVARGLHIAGFAVLTWGLATRWQIAGRVPASNMYESMLFLGWGVALVGVVAIALRNRMLIFNAAAMSALATTLLDLLPIDPFIHPMPPVLSGTPWLAIHVPIIMIGYACLAIVTLFGHLVVGAEIFAPHRRDLKTRWSELLYWYTHVGSILLLAGILTGSIWAASSWGRYWGWDPKEVWSLVAFLAYMAILHARFDGQIRSFQVAAWSIAAFWTILMTYLGVNFVLASGLHSYGFGSSNLVRVMVVIGLVEAAFLTAGVLAHRKLAQAGQAID